MKSIYTAAMIGVSAAAIVAPHAAYAQGAAAKPAADEATPDKDIIVTGTLIRGVAPIGTNVVGVSAENIQATGANTTAQLLQSVPQLGAFNDLFAPSSSGNSVTVNRPNLRSLPGFNTAGGSSTLVLLNGHRLVGMGITSTTPDPDVIPPTAIERVEIVPDGGSAVYGSDAIAGVINFITRKRYDGVGVDAHYGFGKNYWQWDASAIVGKDWGSGSIYLSYNYAKNDRITGAERGYVKLYPDANGFLPTQCNPGTVTVAGVTYPLPGKVAGAPNQCDTSDDATVYPANRRHSLFASFMQELSSSVSVDIHAYYTHRVQDGGGGTFRPGSPTTVTSANPFFAARRIGAETSHSVTFGFGDANSIRQSIRLDSFGITPTLTAKLGSSWQLKVTGNYGQSLTELHLGAYNTTALTNAFNAGLFTPYDPNNSDASALAIIKNFETFGRARQEIENVKAIVDGDLFRLPGGAVKVAIGGEIYHEGWQSRAGSIVPGFSTTTAPAQLIGATTIAPAVAPPRLNNLSRSVKSVFGELVVPLFGADNATTLFQELSVSLSGRYDKYSDFGDTFNPKVGVSWKPFEMLKLRGSWGKSFNAPSLADSRFSDVTTLFVLPAAAYSPPAALQPTPYPSPAAGQFVYVLRGNSDGIKPQKARTFSIGGDFTPTSNTKFSVTYYSIDLKGVIGIPLGPTSATIYTNYPQAITISPSTAFLNSLSALADVTPFGAPCHAAATPCSVYAVADGRKSNLGDFQLKGLDFGVNTTMPTSFGGLDLAVNANYELQRRQRSSTTAAWQDLLGAFNVSNSRFKMRTSLGANVGDLRGQVTWNHNHGYKFGSAVGFVPQTHAADFNTFDLFFKYDFKNGLAGKDLTLSLGITNVFDQDPPQYRLVNSFVPGASGFINGNTLGRVVQVGIGAKF
jgi:iron complex outermembrane recepter protein